MHDHCSALLNDLDTVLNDFSTLLSNSKKRRMPAPPSSVSRNSIDSTSTGEFYDAEPGDVGSQLLIIDRQSEEDTQPSEVEDEFVTDASSISSAGDEYSSAHLDGKAALFPVKPKFFANLANRLAIIGAGNFNVGQRHRESPVVFVRSNVLMD